MTRGYLAAGDGAGLGVVVLGGDAAAEHVHSICDRLAAEGFTALAPDGDLDEAVDSLAAHDAVRGHGVGVVGFGTGGATALWLAGHRPDQVRVVVPFYATAGHEPDWDALTAPVEAHYGDQDDVAPPELAHRYEAELTSRRKAVRLFMYPGAGHGFFDDSRVDTYDDDAARQAWVRTLEFLRAKLG